METTQHTPANVRERVAADADEIWYHWIEGQEDLAIAALRKASDEELARFLDMLARWQKCPKPSDRTPRGEGAGVVAAASAYLRALDTYRKECRDREIPLAEYAYDEFRRLAEPLVEAEERLRAALRSDAQGEAEPVAWLVERRGVEMFGWHPVYVYLGRQNAENIARVMRDGEWDVRVVPLYRAAWSSRTATW